jgi:L-ascorbate metabolism protein UlaG (beta-lactamase superfamily)
VNDGIDPETIQNPTYLYISHLHHDHFLTPAWLATHVDRSATVILPDYPIGDLGAASPPAWRFIETADPSLSSSAAGSASW